MTEKELILDWRENNNKNSLQKLIDIYDKYIEYWCFRYSDNKDVRKDLYQEAVLGVILALTRIDLSKIIKPITYIHFYIKRAIKDYIIKTRFSVSISCDQPNFKLYNKYASLIDESTNDVTHSKLRYFCAENRIKLENAKAFVMWMKGGFETTLKSEDVSEQYCLFSKLCSVLKSFTEYQKDCFFYITMKDVTLEELALKWGKVQSSILTQARRSLEKVQLELGV